MIDRLRREMMIKKVNRTPKREGDLSPGLNFMVEKEGEGILIYIGFNCDI